MHKEETASEGKTRKGGCCAAAIVYESSNIRSNGQDWTRSLVFVENFLHHNLRWPSLGTGDPIETMLAEWLNANLDLHWTDRLPETKSKAMNRLIHQPVRSE